MLEHPERSFTTDRKGSRALIRRTVATVQHRSFTESACPPDTCRSRCRDDHSGFFGPRLVSPPRPKPILSGPDAGRPHRLFGNTFLDGSGSGNVGLSLWFFAVSGRSSRLPLGGSPARCSSSAISSGVALRSVMRSNSARMFSGWRDSLPLNRNRLNVSSTMQCYCDPRACESVIFASAQSVFRSSWCSQRCGLTSRSLTL